MNNQLNSLEREKSLILVIDDDEGIRSQIKWALADEYHVIETQNADESIEIVKQENPNLVTLDITLTPFGDSDGIKILETIVQYNPRIKVIMITGHDEKEIALKAIQLGAHDFYQKPIDLEELKTIIRRALYVQKLELENEFLLSKVQQEKQFEDIIGDSPQILQVYDVLRKLTTTDVHVLIQGESGTGKELVARAIHYQSLRRDKPFIPINCGAIPENLLESELFGHEKGAFTGAYYHKKGKFEIAHKGTVFLDEIGELSPSLQVKLLRFLQEKEIERVGGSKRISVDVRIVAATNKDLEKEIQTNNFRTDLYFRLNVINITVPPLRDRGDDIILLANSFLNKYSKEYKKKFVGFDALAIKRMEHYNWPGNVRELENRIKRAVLMGQKRLIRAEDLGLSDEVSADKESFMEALDHIQKEYINIALNRTKGNISRAARELGISRVTLYELLNKFQIEAKKYRELMKG